MPRRTKKSRCCEAPMNTCAELESGGVCSRCGRAYHSNGLREPRWRFICYDAAGREVEPLSAEPATRRPAIRLPEIV